ncbi:hypothetical protein F5Y10DRAFT_212798 [Nemania abortiva]|nr:hypothetical protein F5Y10DRAFT_212798 [Nemania abortiva]
MGSGLSPFNCDLMTPFLPIRQSELNLALTFFTISVVLLLLPSSLFPGQIDECTVVVPFYSCLSSCHFLVTPSFPITYYIP